jgi:hypothetical protein
MLLELRMISVKKMDNVNVRNILEERNATNVQTAIYFILLVFLVSLYFAAFQSLFNFSIIF